MKSNLWSKYFISLKTVLLLINIVILLYSNLNNDDQGKCASLKQFTSSIYCVTFVFLLRLLLLLSAVMILPIVDVTSDYMATDKHFRRNDTGWGSMTMSLTFMPSILGLFCLSGSWTDKLYLFIFLLPIVQILLFAQQGWKILQESIKGYMTAWQMISKATKSETKRLKSEIQRATAQREANKSGFQVFKIFESIGEAGPQSILQSSILLKQTSSLANTWNLIMQDYHISPFKSILLTILSSLISLVLTGGAMMVELAFKINGQTVIPYHRLWRIVLHSVLMIPVIIPRVLSLSIIFASFDSWYSVIPTLIILGQFWTTL